MRIIGNDPTKPRQTAAVASGTLPNGKPVVVNADGTVSVVSGTSGSESVGTEVTYNAANTQQPSAVYDSNAGKIIIAMQDYAASGAGRAIVGTISGTSISFGTKVQYESGSSDYNSAAYDPVNSRVIIVYRDNGDSNKPKVVLGTVSGTSISFNSPKNLSSNTANNIAGVAYDASTGNFVVAWSDQGNGHYGTAIAGQIDPGDSITLGTPIIYNSAVTYHSLSSVVYDAAAERVIVPYKNNGNSGRGTAVVLTGSGTSLSAGTPVVFETDSIDNSGIDAVYDSTNQKIVIVYPDTTSKYIHAVVGTVSGSSITFGTPVVNTSHTLNWLNAAYDSFAQKVIINFGDYSNLDYGTVLPFSVSGTTGTFDTATVYNSANSRYMSAAYDSTNQKTALVFTDWGTDYYGKVVVYAAAYNTTNLTANNYIGMSDGVLEDLSQSEATGSPSVFATTEALQSSSAYDSSSNKIILAWRDDNSGAGYGKAVVITVSGTSLSYGTPVTFNAGSTRTPSVVYDSSNNKVVIAYRNDANSNYSTAIVGTVSGTSISFGSPVVYESAGNSAIDATYDSANSKVVVTAAGIGGGTAKVWVGTVSGTSITFGSSASLSGAYDTNLAYDSTNDKIIAVIHSTASSGQAYVGTVSGTSISFGSAVTFDSTNFNALGGVIHDTSNNKTIISYVSGQVSAIVGTVSGTSITFGAEQTVNANASDSWVSYDSRVNKPVFVYQDDGNSGRGTVVTGTLSGTSISFSSPTIFETGDTRQTFASFHSGEGTTVISYYDAGNSNYGTAVGYQAAGTYQVRGEVADGGNAVVDVQGGISDIQENLTAGQSYYVQTDGTISTTAGDPSVFAGTAVSSTKMIVKG